MWNNYFELNIPGIIKLSPQLGGVSIRNQVAEKRLELGIVEKEDDFPLEFIQNNTYRTFSFTRSWNPCEKGFYIFPERAVFGNVLPVSGFCGINDIDGSNNMHFTVWNPDRRKGIGSAVLEVLLMGAAAGFLRTRNISAYAHVENIPSVIALSKILPEVNGSDEKYRFFEINTFGYMPSLEILRAHEIHKTILKNP